MMIAIKHRRTEEILYESKKSTIKEAVEEAVSKNINLEGANLKGINIEGANLRDTKF